MCKPQISKIDVMGVDLEEGYKEFVKYHEQQLRHNGLPEEAWRQVYEKLQPKTVLDIDTGLQVQDGAVVALKPHQPYSCVYIVPHLWTGNGSASTYSALNEDIDQPAKLLDIMGLPCDSPAKSSKPTNVVIEELAQVCGCSYDTAKKAYSEAKGDIILAVQKVGNSPTDNLDGDKLAESLNLPKKQSILTYEEFKSAVTEEKSEAELEQLYNDYARKKQHEIGEDGFGTTDKYKWSDDAEEHVITVTIPVPPGLKRGDVFSKVTSRHWTFGIRGESPIIYGNFQGIVQADECTWYFEKGTNNIIASIQKCTTEDYMWQNLIVGEEKINEGFLVCERRRSLLRALDQLWSCGLTYQAITTEGRQSHNWYLPPQTVTKMTHSKNPSFRLAPFWSCYGGKTVTLLWPIKNTKVSETCSLDKYVTLFNSEPDIQRQARIWAINPANISKQVPKSFKNQYESLLPPHKYKPSNWIPVDDIIPENDDKLTVVTTMVLSSEAREVLKELGVTVTNEEVPGCSYWKQGREKRDGLNSVNSFDTTLTNIIQLNTFIKSSFGSADWWPAGYHLNKELAALLASPSAWDLLWFLRCSEDSALSVISSHQARLARLCENSLTYFAQPFIDSLQVENCQCSLEFTIVIRDKQCFVSDIPAIHKARLSDEEGGIENYYLIDHFVPRSDGSHFPSTVWPNFLLQFSLRDSWPATEAKIDHILHDLVSNLTAKTSEVHCYGVQVIITPDLQIKVVGINPSPTYFPSVQHLASAWKMLFCKPATVQSGFRNLF